MTKDKGGRLRFIYGIFLALLTVFVGAVFIVQIWALYRSAPNSPYTEESVAKYFDDIAICIWMWGAAFLGSIILAIAYPSTPARPKANVPAATLVERAKKRLPVEYAPQASGVGKKEKRFRKIVTLICFGVVAVASALCLGVLCDKLYVPLFRSQFFTSHNSAPDRLVQCVALAILVLCFACLAVWAVEGSLKKEQKTYLALIAKAQEEKKLMQAAELAEAREASVSKKQTVEEAPVAVEEKPVVAEKEEFVVDPSKRWNKFIRMVAGVFFLGEKHTRRALRKEADMAMGLEETPEEKREKKERAKAEQLAKKQAMKAEKRAEKLAMKAERKAMRANRKRKELSPKARAARVWLVRIALCVVGVVFVLTGIMNGGMKDVLLKAINICTQCIGLG